MQRVFFLVLARKFIVLTNNCMWLTLKKGERKRKISQQLNAGRCQIVVTWESTESANARREFSYYATRLHNRGRDEEIAARQRKKAGKGEKKREKKGKRVKDELRDSAAVIYFRKSRRNRRRDRERLMQSPNVVMRILSRRHCLAVTSSTTMYSSFRQGVNIVYFLSPDSWTLDAGMREERGVEVTGGVVGEWTIEDLVTSSTLNFATSSTFNRHVEKNFQWKLIYC